MEKKVKIKIGDTSFEGDFATFEAAMKKIVNTPKELVDKAIAEEKEKNKKKKAAKK